MVLVNPEESYLDSHEMIDIMISPVELFDLR